MLGSLDNPYPIGSIYDRWWVICDVLETDPSDPECPHLYEIRGIHTGGAYEDEFAYGAWISPGDDVREATPAEQAMILRWWADRDNIDGNELHKWKVSVRVTDKGPDSKTFDGGQTWEEQGYVHLTAEKGVEQKCMGQWGDRFEKFVFLELLD